MVEKDAASGIQLTSSQKSFVVIWAIRWAWVDNVTAKSDSATGVASLSQLKDSFDARYQQILKCGPILMNLPRTATRMHTVQTYILAALQVYELVLTLEK